MLQLTGCVGFGVDVGDLLQLQRRFQANGIVEVAADEENGVVVEELGGILLDALLLLQVLHQFVRN